MTPTLKRSLIAAAAVAGISLVVWGSLRSQKAGAGTEVYVQAAERRDLFAVVTASGEIRPRREVKLSAKTMGEVLRVHAREGQAVRRGDLLLEIDTRKLVQERRRLEAVVEAARSQVSAEGAVLENAELSFARQEALFAQGFSPRSALDAAKLERDTARSRLENARARLVETEAALSRLDEEIRDAKIFSPMDGTLTRLHVEAGETAVVGTMGIPGSVLAEVADLSEMVVKVNVDETEINRVALGQPAIVSVDADADFKYFGEVVEIGTSAAARMDKVNSFPVEVRVLGRNGGGEASPEIPAPVAASLPLKPGMSADVRIEIGRREGVIAVPISSVVTRDGRKTVFVVDGGRAMSRPVSTGISDDTHVEITDGVVEGEKAVTGPHREIQRLEDGARVKEKIFKVQAKKN
jgi:HlyD family secretion protein